MDLTSRKAVHDGMTKYGFVAPDMTVHEFVEDELPSVPAVPLEKLCEWLADYAAPPGNASEDLALLEHEARAKAWRYFWEKMMGKKKEEEG